MKRPAKLFTRIPFNEENRPLPETPYDLDPLPRAARRSARRRLLQTASAKGSREWGFGIPRKIVSGRSY